MSHGTNAIYFLEAWAALIAPVIFRPWLTSTYLQLCDNEAAKHAIRRGVGKHQPLNCLLGAHCTWHNRQQLQLHVARVPTHANIADPFSRHDMSLAHEHGWHVLQPPMHALHRRMCRIHNVGFDEVPEPHKFHQSHITQGGQDFPRPMRARHTSKETCPVVRTSFPLLCLGRSPSASPSTGVDYDGRTSTPSRYLAVQHFGLHASGICLPFMCCTLFESVVSKRHRQRLHADRPTGTIPPT